MHQISRLELPAISEFNPATRRCLDRMELSWGNLYNSTSSKLDPDALCQIYWEDQSRDLRHPLSELWSSLQTKNSIRSDRSSEDEIRLSRIASSLFAGLKVDNHILFTDWLCMINSHALNRDKGFIRVTESATTADINGARNFFCEANNLGCELQRLHDFLASQKDHPALCAVTALCSLLTLHPFVDGNGRVARAAFNAISASMSQRELFLPLHLIFNASQGGFEIRLKEVQTNKNWSLVYLYFGSIFDLCLHARDA